MKSFPAFFVTGALLIGLISCGQPDSVEITETLKQSEYNPPEKPGATSDERFARELPPTPPAAAAAPASSSSSDGETAFHYSVPAGWTELPPSQFRTVNLASAVNPELECYVSVLPGSGSGVEANVNRWRNQFGEAPYTADEMSGLPRVPILGADAVLVNFGGTFTSMQGEAKENYHLLGAIVSLPDKLVTIKMIGPDALVKTELRSFAGFVDSLHEDTGDHSHGAPGSDAAAPAAEPVTAKNGFSWAIPEGWLYLEHPSPMRLVTFAVGDELDSECYVVVLGGNGGGMLANMNRWLGQLGQTPLEESELELQPQLELFGKDAPMLIAQGEYTGMGNALIQEAMLLGAAGELEEVSVFIKLVGPLSSVQSNWGTFKEFCASLKQD